MPRTKWDVVAAKKAADTSLRITTSGPGVKRPGRDAQRATTGAVASNIPELVTAYTPRLVRAHTPSFFHRPHCIPSRFLPRYYETVTPKAVKAASLQAATPAPAQASVEKILQLFAARTPHPGLTARSHCAPALPATPSSASHGRKDATTFTVYHRSLVDYKWECDDPALMSTLEQIRALKELVRAFKGTPGGPGGPGDEPGRGRGRSRGRKCYNCGKTVALSPRVQAALALARSSRPSWAQGPPIPPSSSSCTKAGGGDQEGDLSDCLKSGHIARDCKEPLRSQSRPPRPAKPAPEEAEKAEKAEKKTIKSRRSRCAPAPAVMVGGRGGRSRGRKCYSTGHIARECKQPLRSRGPPAPATEPVPPVTEPPAETTTEVKPEAPVVSEAAKTEDVAPVVPPTEPAKVDAAPPTEAVTEPTKTEPVPAAVPAVATAPITPAPPPVTVTPAVAVDAPKEEETAPPAPAPAVTPAVTPAPPATS
ncbi:hypothetical protein G7Z17_g11523 [Cylindrodendrum hubeiense]|uniref:Uncharacterized protein n=1 Tax=Cylindrodendrum hubeiense TaxID=595255 RepID=A0A9P5LB80_9HYPO|nr:hypothetical protein G7Z17_g11523 [Cylindrodendrum hubeiense]